MSDVSRLEMTPVGTNESPHVDGVLLVGHGSREPGAITEYHQFARRFSAAINLPVYPCFLELADPSVVQGIQSCVEAGARRVVVLPLFLGPGGHQKNDVPSAINWARGRWPQVRFHYGTPLGAQAQIVDALAEGATTAILASPLRIPLSETAILLAGRGSRDPDSNSEVFKVARLLWEGREYATVEVAFHSLTGPNVESGIRRCVQLGSRRIIVIPYLLFGGTIESAIIEQARTAQQQFPNIDIRVAEHLGAQQGILEALRLRYEEAASGAVAMNCDLCKYRQRMAGYEHELGLRQTSDHHHGLRGVPDISDHDHFGHGSRHAHEAAAAIPLSKRSVTFSDSITQDALAIVRRELAAAGYTLEWPFSTLVERIIHTTADFAFADITEQSPGAIEAGVAALRAGCSLVTDVNMVRAGIDERRITARGGTISCFVADSSTRERAAAAGITRSAMAMRIAGERGMLDGAVVAIGNAPTALLEVVRLIENGARPALVIGVPVGFINTEESKAALRSVETVPWILTAGRKGGSPVAVAIVHALLQLASDTARSDRG